MAFVPLFVSGSKITPLYGVGLERIKKLAGQLPAQEFCDWIYSWMNGYARYISDDQRENIYELEDELLNKYYREEIATERWILTGQD